MDHQCSTRARSQSLPEENIGVAIPMTSPATRGLIHPPSDISGYSNESASEWGFITQSHATFLYDDSSESESGSECTEFVAEDPQPLTPLSTGRSRSQTVGLRSIHPRATTLNRGGRPMRPFAQYQQSWKEREAEQEERRINVEKVAVAVALIGVKSRRRGEYFHDVQTSADGTFARSATPPVATVRRVNIKRGRRRSRRQAPATKQTKSLDCGLCKPLPPLPQAEAMYELATRDR
ncbi:uncharacterized protein PAC_16923 [Phialocephala subalpina]|uniref:Uncharacterized protein n=1 Tax=Phialocephala subalpina TaxID=576137 RepID=A0A1L7XPR4_9HELO|nr:uncharacterized protein PAC_16923 [Phialocephala subalpina]